MPIKVEISCSHTFESARALESVFQYCADFNHSIPANFPGLEKFEDVGDSIYQWVFQKVRYGRYGIQIKLKTRFALVPNKSVEIVPIPESGFSTLEGRWTFSELAGKTRVTFNVKLIAEIPVPFFLRSVATPITQREIGKYFSRYSENVAQALS